MTRAIQVVRAELRTIPRALRPTVEAFVSMAGAQGAVFAVTCEETIEQCGVFLADGTDIPCLAVAEGPDKTFAALDAEGRFLRFAEDELR